MLSVFQDCPCRVTHLGDWSRGGVIIALSWQSLPAPGVPSMAELSLCDAGAFRGVGLPVPPQRCCAWHCLAMLQSQGVGLPLQHQSLGPN